MPASSEVTQLLVEWQNGSPQALERLMPLVYGELRAIARRYLSRERADHTLQSTSLVHEAYFKLVDQRNVQWQNRAHFLGIAAQLMRRILVDHARTAHRQKRGGPLPTRRSRHPRRRAKSICSRSTRRSIVWRPSTRSSAASWSSGSSAA
jgi:RNA polymerase sigma factor (TIGR02999 family)